MDRFFIDQEILDSVMSLNNFEWIMGPIHRMHAENRNGSIILKIHGSC